MENKRTYTKDTYVHLDESPKLAYIDEIQLWNNLESNSLIWSKSMHNLTLEGWDLKFSKLSDKYTLVGCKADKLLDFSNSSQNS